MELPLDSKQDVEVLCRGDKCDHLDYLAAIGCGAIAGLVDVFFVGMPGDSRLGSWADEQVNHCVMNFAKLSGWSPKMGNEENLKSAIGHLEKAFPVNYDQSHSGMVGNLVEGMNTKNHHMLSLAHSPSPLGLFFSILNQFTATSTFISGGNLVTVNTATSYLQGGNFVARLFCGFVNWLGHLISDVAGSSGAAGRGSGIVMPFYELFGFCNFGKFDIGKDKQTLAVLAQRAFKEGYDLRHGAAMAIPVVLCEISIRLIWSLRRFFGDKRPLNQCIPTKAHEDLRVMLLFGHGTLCLIDGLDAAIRSGGNALTFFMRMNLVAWLRFAYLVFKEICLRAHISLGLQGQIDAFKRINMALQDYLHELEKIDREQFLRETAAYNDMVACLNNAHDEKELNVQLYAVLAKMNIKTVWEDSHDDFDDFMKDRQAVMVFE